MDQAKELFTKYKKIIIALIVILVVGAGAKVGLDMHNNNIINRVNLAFDGYNGSGYASISNYDSTMKYMGERLLEKNGIKKNLAKEIVASDDAYNSDLLSSDDQAKVKEILSEMSSLRLEIKGKNSSLSNGDKVTVTFKNYNSELPFKSGSKTFTVKGLEKTTKVSSKTVFDDLKIKSIGVNGKGQIALSSKNSDLIASTIKVKNNGDLSNGDKVSLKLPKAAFKDDSGKQEFTGSRTFEYEVSGLIDSKSVTNIDDIKSATDTVMSDYTDDRSYSDTEYTSKFVSLYATPYDGSDDAYFDDEESTDVTNKVIVSDARETGSSTNNRLTIVAIYTVTNSDSDSDEEPDDVAVTVNNLSLKDDKLNIDDKKMTASDNVSSFEDSIKIYERNLEVTGLKLK